MKIAHLRMDQARELILPHDLNSSHPADLRKDQARDLRKDQAEGSGKKLILPHAPTPRFPSSAEGSAEGSAKDQDKSAEGSDLPPAPPLTVLIHPHLLPRFGETGVPNRCGRLARFREAGGRR